MHALPSLLDDALRHISAGALCVGFSGGLDSTALLHALASVPAARARGLRAWHVHHGLHVDADQWVTHCQATCAALGIALTTTRVDVARDGGHGPEAAARQARHAAFREGLDAGEILVFAHHRDDQAETFLLRAMRASGPDGLGAIRPWREFGRGHLWRPLLDVPRARLEAHAADQGLQWIEDPGNVDESFDRNFLRHRVLPLLRERWPHASDVLARSATLCLEAGDLLGTDDDDALATVLTEPAGSRDPSSSCTRTPSVSRSRLLRLPPPRRARVLRRWIETLDLPPLPAAGVAQVESTLLAAREDASASFEWHGAVIHAWRDGLHADWVRPPLPENWQVTWDGVAPLPLPGGGMLSLQLADTGFGRKLLVHGRRGGERITLPGREHRHSLKQVLQDRAVPPWQRLRMPLLSTLEGELLAVADVACSAAFDQWLQANGARLCWDDPSTQAAVD